MADPSEHLTELIEELREVLEEERRTLLSGSAEAINAVTQHKMLVADMIEQATTLPGTPRPRLDLLTRLMRYNQENAVICDALLRHLTAAIDKLHRYDRHRSYKSDGSEESRSAQHPLGAA